MKIGNIDTDKEILIIAEIGNNHEGNIELAKQMIGLAAKAGAHAVKFQTIVPERLVSSDQSDRIQQLNRFRLSYAQFELLKHVCDDEGIMFLSTPFDLESAEFLNHLVPAFKISSGDNTFYPLLTKVAKTGKPILLSTGMTTLGDIRKSITVITNSWKEHAIDSGEVALLHCNVSYPTPPEDVNLRVIESLKSFGYTVGYSDHTRGIDAAVLSAAFGARIIEKHFTSDKTKLTFRDHQLSADPEDLRALVRKVKSAILMTGSGIKQVTQSEGASVCLARRSIAAARDIAEGEEITLDALMWVRPGTGIPAGNESTVIGHRAIRKITYGCIVRSEDISQ